MEDIHIINLRKCTMSSSSASPSPSLASLSSALTSKLPVFELEWQIWKSKNQLFFRLHSWDDSNFDLNNWHYLNIITFYDLVLIQIPKRFQSFISRLVFIPMASLTFDIFKKKRQNEQYELKQVDDHKIPQWSEVMEFQKKIIKIFLAPIRKW